MTQPKIAIVGAGIAGLNAAYQLKKAGYYATVYEAQDRVGGRIYSVKDRLGPGLVTELGAELINTAHADMLGLIETFGLPTFDRRGPTEIELRRYGYYYDGAVRTQEEMVVPFKPMQERLDEDLALMSDDPEHLKKLDNMTVEAYIEQTGVDGWMRELLNVASTAFSGRATDDQSALNYIWLGPHTREGKVFPYGKSDGRYSILGGNSQLIDALAKEVDSQIEPSQRLEAITERGSKIVLTINGRDIETDFAIIAVPFSVLRHARLEIELKPTLRRMINEFNYGWSAKLLVGTDGRPWRNAGYTGSLSTDEGFHSAWDSSQCQPTDNGSLTFYTGAELGRTLHQQDIHKLADQFVASYDKFAPGTEATFNGRVDLGIHWPSFEFSEGAYGCAGPGQYTAFIKENQWEEGDLIGIGTHNLLFAGEHVSADFQGHMNGGAQTGRLAATALVDRLL